jgi:beta-mannosidase
VPADKAIEIARLKKGELPAGQILIMDYDAADGSKARAHFAAEPYKALHIIDPQLTQRTEIKSGKLHIHLAAHHAALFVVAETGVDGHYSDNVLDLLPGESATIVFTPDNPADLKSAAQNLVIRNLYSSSH